MADKYKIDYNAIFAEVRKILSHRLNAEAECSNLLDSINQYLDDSPYLLSTIAENLVNLRAMDRVIFLRAYKSLTIVCRSLQAKYNFDIVEDDD